MTFKDVMRKVFPGYGYTMNKRDWAIEFRKGVPQIWLCGVENTDRVEKVLGMGLNLIFLNEISQIGYKAFYTIMTRMAEKGVRKNKILLDANPPPRFHWSYKRYILGVDPTDGHAIDTSKFRVLKMNPSDNLPNIDPDYIETLKSLPLHVQERYLYGNFAKGTDSGVYSKELEDVETSGRLGDYPQQMNLPIHAVFDIGISDATAIWFCHFLENRIYLFNYFSANRKALPYYVDYAINVKGYKLQTVVLPHDAKNKNWGTGRTIRESAEELGRKHGFDVHVLADQRVADGINAARMLFPRMFFDKRGTGDGFEALQNYQYVYSEKRGTDSDSPFHNWASHGSDAFRYMCLFYRTWNIYDEKLNRRSYTPSFRVNDNGLGTFRDMFRAKGIKI
jgi:phage terminase large subunit